MKFYPAASPVPEEKRTDRLWLRPLRAADAALDYDAVMSSAEQLRRWSGRNWPSDEFTLAQNREGLQAHEREHRAREAFTFTVLDPPGTMCLGCVYIMPPETQIAALCADAAYPANVGFWVRTSALASDLDTHLLATLREWLATDWAFDCIVFTISQQETRQAGLFREAGLVLRAASSLSDGRPCWVFS
ncbi:MAG TPA: GNAT family N-acetyltransferase [Herpetosiphonaceae bacterium]